MNRKVNKLIAVAIALMVVFMATSGIRNSMTPEAQSRVNMGASVSNSYNDNGRYMSGSDEDSYMSY